MADNFEGDPQSYAAFRRAVSDAGLELQDGRFVRPDVSADKKRRPGSRPLHARGADVKEVRWRDRGAGGGYSAVGAGRRRGNAASTVTHTIKVASEDDLIEQGDLEAAAQSDQVHQEWKGDIGGWTGGTVWEASQALSRLLVAQPPSYWERRQRVVELGCGCGMVGMVAAAVGARVVVLTDQVIQFVKFHLK